RQWYPPRVIALPETIEAVPVPIAVSPVIFIPNTAPALRLPVRRGLSLSGYRPALPRWRPPVVAELRCEPRRLPYRVEYIDKPPSLEDWLVSGKAPAPGRWSAVEAIGAHVRFRPKAAIRAMRGYSRETWKDAGGKRWRTGKARRNASYSAYLGPRLRPFPYE